MLCVPVSKPSNTTTQRYNRLRLDDWIDVGFARYFASLTFEQFKQTKTCSILNRYHQIQTVILCVRSDSLIAKFFNETTIQSEFIALHAYATAINVLHSDLFILIYPENIIQYFLELCTEQIQIFHLFLKIGPHENYVSRLIWGIWWWRLLT